MACLVPPLASKVQKTSEAFQLAYRDVGLTSLVLHKGEARIKLVLWQSGLHLDGIQSNAQEG